MATFVLHLSYPDRKVCGVTDVQYRPFSLFPKTPLREPGKKQAPKLSCSVLQIEIDCKTMEPQKLGGNRKLTVCELVDQFMK